MDKIFYKDEDSIYNKLSKITNEKFQLKDSYKSVIPLKIFETWHTKDLPPKMKECVEELKRDNPEFDHYLFDLNDCYEFIKNNFSPEVLAAYDSLIPASYKSDMFRFCVLYIHGGIYLDIKFKCTNNFKLIALTEEEHYALDRPGFWISGKIGGSTGLMVMKPKNALLLKCINQIVENVKNNYIGYNKLYPTGPGLLGLVYEEYLLFDDYYKMMNIDICFNDDIISYDNAHYIYKNTKILIKYSGYSSDRIKYSVEGDYGALWDKRRIYKTNLLK